MDTQASGKEKLYFLNAGLPSAWVKVRSPNPHPRKHTHPCCAPSSQGQSVSLECKIEGPKPMLCFKRQRLRDFMLHPQ